jgi:uncharacterized membrane protein YphA (DoxX/SURF4 family)
MFTTGNDIGRLVLRLTLGILILLHGLAKIASGPGGIIGMVEKTGLPGELGYLVYVGEVIAPLFLIIGLWARIAAALIAGSMLVAVLLVHTGDLLKLSGSGGWALELQAMFLFVAVAIVLLGPGRYAVSRS